MTLSVLLNYSTVCLFRSKRHWNVESDILLSVDVEIVKLFTMPQILRDWLAPEPFIRLSLFANAMLA